MSEYAGAEWRFTPVRVCEIVRPIKGTSDAE